MRKTLALFATTLLPASLLLSLGQAPAEATDSRISFTADALPTWQTDGIVWAVAQSNGLVFAGGRFTQLSPPSGQSGTAVSRPNFAVLDAATGVPTGCSLNVAGGTNPTVRALNVSPDGATLYVGGLFNTVNGKARKNFAAVDIASCTLTSLTTSPNATIRAIASTASTVYIGGDFTQVSSTTRTRLAAISATGAGLQGWTPTADKSVRALATDPNNGNVVVGGDFDHLDSADSQALGIVSGSSGSLVRSYPVGFFPSTSVVKDISTDSTGFYTSNEGTGGGVFDGRVAIDWSSYNQRWRDTCLGATQATVSYQGVLYSASHAHDCSSMGEYPDGRRQHLLAEGTNSPSLLPWYPDTNGGYGEQVGPRGMVVATSGGEPYLWVTGEFTTVNGSAQIGLTRFGTGPDTGKPTIPVASATSIAPGEALVRWRTSTDDDDSTLTYRVYRNNATTPIWTGTADSSWWSRGQRSFVDTTVTAGQTYTYRVTASDGTNTSSLSAKASVTVATATATYPQTVRGDGAQLYWRYDESSGSFAADTSTADSSGVYQGGIGYRATGAVPQDPSTAATFNGSDAFVYGEHRAPGPGTFSVETWFKTTTTSGGKLVGFGNSSDGTSSNYDKHIYMTNNGRLVFGVYTGSTQTITSSSSYNDGSWHYVVGTQGSSGMTLWVDGVKVGTNGTTTNQSYTGGWRVGGDNLAGWPDRPASDYFSGTIDETAVYPTVLTSSQVAAHYAAGKATATTTAAVTAGR